MSCPDLIARAKENAAFQIENVAALKALDPAAVADALDELIELARGEFETIHDEKPETIS
jgi:hypothetical protein